MEKGDSNSLRLNSWVSLIETSIEKDPESYFHLKVPDYVFVLAMTESGKVPLVQQYRIPLERNSLELPAGLIESNQTPLETAKRELEEETGLKSQKSVFQLPPMVLDSGRIQNKAHGFVFLGVEELTELEMKSAELKTIWVTAEELLSMAISGKIDHMGQVALILWAAMAGHLGDEVKRKGGIFV
jgi:ADP-ribose pyrophosphatase